MQALWQCSVDILIGRRQLQVVMTSYDTQKPNLYSAPKKEFSKSSRAGFLVKRALYLGALQLSWWLSEARINGTHLQELVYQRL